MVIETRNTDGTGRSEASVFENLPEDKQRRILGAAVDEFAERGFGGASINRLVSRLGIAKGSIFQYFGSKQGLFAYVFDRASGLFADNLRQVRDQSADEPFFDRLHRVLEAGVAFIDANPRVYRIYLKMLYDESMPGRDLFLGRARAYSAKFLRPMVERAAERGELRPDLDPDFAAFLLDAAMDRFLQACVVEEMDGGLNLRDPAERAKRLRELTNCLRRGLGAPQGETP
ncbi:TetR/AcrR family transcriptional regulator [Desulfohalovibrio reitneri]|uniref:TetR/AcrR family transcriptional regulator n=1 Tax=Desulfohalovibrio reitneri TaxID=1307759 RepID=UPI00068EE64D|nr:TetR/AcrR family transcriptional regulator [Desulfohalovibrio reitneri]